MTAHYGTHEHHHYHGHQRHNHSNTALGWSFGVIAAFAIVEAVGGYWSGSLALLGDAGHMVTDACALGLAALAARIAHRPATHTHSFGLARTEVVAALINGALMIAVVTFIAVEAVHRLSNPVQVSGWAVSLIAAIGLIVNIAVALRLHGGEQTLNSRAALLHVLGDLLASVAALVAGFVIVMTGWTPIDPILSLLICVLILISAIRLLKEVLNVIMEGVPPGIDLPEVGRFMATTEGVLSVHDLHIWRIGSDRPVLSAHVVIGGLDGWSEILPALQAALKTEYGIDHVTLQPEICPWEVITWSDGSAGTIP